MRAGARSLGNWLSDNADQLGARRVVDVINPMDYEATAILAQMETPAGAPPVLFDRLLDKRGDESSFRMLFNAYSRRESVASALGLETEGWNDLLEALPSRSAQLAGVSVEDTAAVQEQVVERDEVDLRALPWVRHVALEGGDYFTPIIVAKGPRTSRYNLSWNRVMYLDPTHAGVHISPRQLWAFQRQAEEGGEDLPVAVVLGHHPAFNLAAAALTPLGVDEYEVAGALLAAPVKVAPSVTFGDELLIPAEAEAVIEGRLLAGRRVVEGPFGEYMRYLGPQKLSHVLEVDAITTRRRPIILEIFAGHQDHLNAHVSIHASILATARSVVPQVTALGWFTGGGPTTTIVGLDKSAEGQPMRAAMAVMAASNLVKQVVVVDSDIDVFDSQQVLWAVSTRVRAERDLSIIKGLQGSLLDPSHPGFGTTTGFVIDATWPLDAPHPPSAHVPPDAIARYPIDRYTFEEM